jgi:activator of HSP90 ATPase
MSRKDKPDAAAEEEKRGNLTTAMANDIRLQEARTANLPSRMGSCEVCKRKGEVRYFVAAKLPRHVHLCDKHYLLIRGKLEKTLTKIVRDREMNLL